MKLFDYLLYGAVIFGWSTSWLPLKWQLGVVAPEVSIFWRFLMAALVMFLLTKLATKENLWLSWRDHLRIMPMGVCLFSLNFTLFYYGGLNSTSGLLAVVFSTASLINIFLVAVLQQQMPRLVHLFAALIGFLGIGLIYSPMLTSQANGFIGLMLCLSGTLVFCTGNMISSRNQKQGLPVMASTSWGMLYGVIVLGLVSLARGHSFTIEWTPHYLGGLFWLSFVSSVMAFTAYLTLLGRIGPGRAGYATVIFPVGALLLSTFFEAYQWTPIAFVGLVFVLTGNILMLRSR